MDDELLELRWAYSVLGVKHEAADHTIKKAYRAAMKKWHPDRWVHDPNGHDIAARKAREINDAFDKIKHAPLRYHISTHPKVQKRAQRQRGPGGFYSKKYQDRATRPPPRSYAKVQRGRENTARFITGLLLGFLLVLYIDMRHDEYAVEFMSIHWGWYVAVPIIVGYINTRVRDDLWHSMLDWSPWWW